MKKQLIPGMVMLAFSLIITFGSVTFLGPCVHVIPGFIRKTKRNLFRQPDLSGCRFCCMMSE